jgi:hypothetical protein
MVDPSTISLADLLGSLSSLTGAILAVGTLLVLWELAILLGALIGSLKDGSRKPDRGGSWTGFDVNQDGRGRDR